MGRTTGKVNFLQRSPYEKRRGVSLWEEQSINDAYVIVRLFSFDLTINMKTEILKTRTFMVLEVASHAAVIF